MALRRGVKRRLPWLAGAMALATPWLGCGGDTDAGGTGASTSTGGSGGSTTTSHAGGGTGAAGGSSGTGSPEACLQSAELELDCTAEGTIVWSVYGDSFGCLVTAGSTSTMASFLFWMSEVVDGDPQIRGLRLAPPAPGSIMDDRIEFTAPQPVPLSTLPSTLPWAVTITPNPVGAAFAFSEGESDAAEVQLDEPIDPPTLISGAEIAKGTFSLQGGTYIVLDGGGQGHSVDDASARGIGCFHLAAELHPLDLD